MLHDGCLIERKCKTDKECIMVGHGGWESKHILLLHPDVVHGFFLHQCWHFGLKRVKSGLLQYVASVFMFLTKSDTSVFLFVIPGWLVSMMCRGWLAFSELYGDGLYILKIHPRRQGS